MQVSIKIKAELELVEADEKSSCIGCFFYETFLRGKNYGRSKPFVCPHTDMDGNTASCLPDEDGIAHIFVEQSNAS